MTSMSSTYCLLILTFVAFTHGVCLSPLIPRAPATIAAPILDINQTALSSGQLNLRAYWATVAGRTFQYAGIGSSGECSDILARAFAFDNSADSCLSSVDMAYDWDFQAMSQACAAEFVYQNTGFYTTITFPWELRFTDLVQSTRGATTTTYEQTHTSVLLITITFPNQVSASTIDAPRIFSNESIAINAIVTSQIVTNAQPFNVSVLTQVGRSFALDPTSVSMVSDLGFSASVAISVLQADTFSASGTRTQGWILSITPLEGSCQFTGNYTLEFDIEFTLQDDQGNPLPANQNPLSPGARATVVLQLESIDFCSTTIADSLVATLETDSVQPIPVTIYQGIPQSNGFFTDARIYFQGTVVSENLALRQTTLEELFITDDQGQNRRDLVDGGAAQDALLDYQPYSLPLAQIPADNALFNLLAIPSYFPVEQDQDQVFIFNALFNVQYAIPDRRKKRDQPQLIANFRFGLSGSSSRVGNFLAEMKRSLEQAQPSSSTLAATTARVGVQRQPTVPPIITSSQPTRSEPRQIESMPSSGNSVQPLSFAIIGALLLSKFVM